MCKIPCHNLQILTESGLYLSLQSLLMAGWLSPTVLTHVAQFSLPLAHAWGRALLGSPSPLAWNDLCPVLPRVGLVSSRSKIRCLLL